ncbi:MAG: acyl-CoA dehydrogenase C-terminal domain-containing protein, partial [Neisseria sp.]|nr:acyl-CoA dehydrogenase C-terminal domain-containing protein [Neisseria sp.]
QAADLAGRKTTGKNGALPLKLLAEGKELADKLAAAEPAAAQQLAQAIETAEQSIARMVGYADRPVLAAAASNAYLQQMGLTLGAIGLARAYLAAESAQKDDADGFGSGFYAAQQHNARVYCAHVLPQVYACAAQIENVQALLDVPLELY